jgi:hypothetical protein
MKRQFIFQLVYLLFLMLFFSNCTNDSIEKIASPPANLTYLINQLNIETGQKASSVMPTLQGRLPFTFSLKSNPSTNEISIDNQGVINVSENIAVGTYKISVIVSNIVSSATFSNVFTVNVKQKLVAPTNLIYSVNKLELEFGVAGNSVVPSIQGNSPINFSIVTNPQTNKISINNQGVITTAANLESGNYTINVIASNVAGTVTFTNAFSVIVKTVNAPSNLVYLPNKIDIEEGQKGNSSVPTLNGTPTFTFSLTTNPVSNQISIDNQGIISVSDNISEGTYQVNVKVSNIANSTDFNNVFTVNVKKKGVLPSNLSYNPNQLSLNFGTAGNSVAPSLQSTQTVNFSMTSNPQTNKIVINSQGIISTAANLEVGTYTINVAATNSIGTVIFNNAYTIIVKAVIFPAANLSYNPNKITVEKGTTVSSVTPTLTGTSPFTFAISSTNTASGQITINSSSGILSASSNTPSGTYLLNISATNPQGTVAFPNAFTFVVEAPNLVSFAANIQPFLGCGGCHNYNSYSSAKADINRILDRVQRTPGSSGFMPQTGIPLTADQINLLKKWVSDGFKQ